MLISLIFLVLSCAFIATLLMSLFKMMSEPWDKVENMGTRVLSIFKLPILIFVAFLIFVLVILPKMEGNG